MRLLSLGSDLTLQREADMRCYSAATRPTPCVSRVTLKITWKAATAVSASLCCKVEVTLLSLAIVLYVSYLNGLRVLSQR